MSTQKRRQSSHDFNIRLNMPLFDQRPGLIAGIVLTLFFTGGILVWIYLFSMDNDTARKILIVEAVVNVILMLVNIYCILRVGYDGFLRNLGMTWLLNVVLTIIGFYIGHIHLLAAAANDQSVLLHGFLEFLVFVLLTALMAVVPTLIICLLMWLIMAIFGK